MIECQICNGTGKFNYEKQKKIIVYGIPIKEILEIIKFAKRKGYRKIDISKKVDVSKDDIIG